MEDEEDEDHVEMLRKVCAAFHSAFEKYEDTQEWALKAIERMIKAAAAGGAAYPTQVAAVLEELVNEEPPEEEEEPPPPPRNERASIMAKLMEALEPRPDADAKPPPLPSSLRQGPELETVKRFAPLNWELWVEDLADVVHISRQLSREGFAALPMPKTFVRPHRRTGPKYHERSAIYHLDRGYTFTRGSQRSGVGNNPRPRDCADFGCSTAMNLAVSSNYRGARRMRPWNDSPGPGTYKDVVCAKSVVNPQRGQFCAAGAPRTRSRTLSYGISRTGRFDTKF